MEIINYFQQSIESLLKELVDLKDNLKWLNECDEMKNKANENQKRKMNEINSNERKLKIKEAEWDCLND